MIAVEDKLLLSFDSIKLGNKKVHSVFLGEDLIWPYELPTEIEYTLKTTQANQTVPIGMLRTFDDFSIASIDFGDGTQETSIVPVFSGTHTVTLNDGSTVEVDNSGGVFHTYAQAGEYKVTIKSTAHIKYIRLNEGLNLSDEQNVKGINNDFIIKIHKFKSDTLLSLDYTFSGLRNCTVDSDFILETPEVTSMQSAFHTFGRNVNDPNFTFSSSLLLRLTKITALRQTFMESGLRFIPEGFFDNQALVTSVWECFKNSYVGNLYYDGRDNSEIVQKAHTKAPFSNGDRIDIIPETLFHKMPVLEDISHCFNYIGAGNFGNWGSGYSSMLIVRRELFWNGKAVGNTKGTIKTAYYTFGKSNRILVEPNILKHVPDIHAIGGMFTQTASSNFMTGWAGMINMAASETEIYSFYRDAEDNPAYNVVAGQGLTFDLNVMFPNVLPNVRSITGAFTSPVSNAGAGFNAPINYTSNGKPAVIDQKLDVDLLLSKFPNATVDSITAYDENILGQSQGTASEKKDGRHGVLYNLNDSRLVNNSAPSLIFNNAIHY